MISYEEHKKNVRSADGNARLSHLLELVKQGNMMTSSASYTAPIRAIVIHTLPSEQARFL